MNRLQKKCFLGATGAHLLLLGVLLVGPAFFLARKNLDDLPVLDVIPAKAVDDALYGGGNPNAKPPPPSIQPPAPAPVVRPPEPKVEPKVEPKKVEPAKVEAVKPPVKNAEPELVETKPKRQLPQVSTELVKRKPTDTNRKTDSARATQAAREKADAQRRAQEVASSIRSLRQNLSDGTAVDTPGPGGAAYANYAQIVKSVYTQAWIVPDDLDDDEANTKVSVTIARDGTVIGSRILSASGNPAMDGSIRRLLDRVTFVHPFPDGAKEARRTFTINFNLKAKKLLG